MENSLFYDELQFLDAAFTPEEFQVISTGSQSSLLKFIVKFPDASSSIDIIFKVSQEYPGVSPGITLHSTSLQNAERVKLEEAIRKYSLTLLDQPMLMELVLWMKTNFLSYCSKFINENTQLTTFDKEPQTLLIIHIDHMRSKTKYVKTLQSWASELNLTGAVLFCKKWIFLIVYGLDKSVKAFMVRLKTSCIDVDSSGKPCKEKMSKVLFEAPSLLSLEKFSVEDFESLSAVETYFSSVGLSQVFHESVSHIVKR